MGSAFLGDYNINTKNTKFNVNERKFDKNKSVFKDWRLDVPRRIEEGFMNEIKYWKVPNFVKDAEELEKIIGFMKKESQFLKTLFVV